MMSKANNLTIADIHNLRYENYEETKNLSFEELVSKTSERAQDFKKGLAKYAERKPYSFDVEHSIAAEQETEYKTKK